MNHNWYSWMLLVVTVCVNIIHLPEPVLATVSKSNPGTAYTYCCPRLDQCLRLNTTNSTANLFQSPQATVHMLWEKCCSHGHSTGIFPAPFPGWSGSKVSYRVSLFTFQLPIIEQIALNQIYSHGLFFVIWVHYDYRIMTELCLKWWQTSWILLVMCSPSASFMLLYCWLVAAWRAILTSSGHKRKMRKFVLLFKNLIRQMFKKIASQYLLSC